MKKINWIVAAFCLCLTNLLGSPLRSNPDFPVYSKQVLAQRLQDMGSIVNLPMDRALQRNIEGYVIRGRRSAESILGRSFLYFPIFEHYIVKHNLPTELKYIAVIESALKPTIISKVGAAGLWQLMPRTAAYYGLRIDHLVDERFDPNKSTEAALKHLAKQYKRFGDWKLAIAAYNCGAGRLLKALKKANSKRYSKIAAHLPKETQSYVRRFVAATYFFEYYLLHDLHPDFPDYHLQLTETRKVYHKQDFQAIAEEHGIKIEVIKRLNPSYKRGLIPPHEQGNYLILPLVGRSSKGLSIILTNKNT